jgi:hypothetical protein
MCLKTLGPDPTLRVKYMILSVTCLSLARSLLETSKKI